MGELLRNRKYRVIVNGEKSEEQDVMSGVPQGTVLAAILFLIMIGDIDKDIISCIVSCFADDTRNSKQIRTEKDKKAMQDDLNRIYQWAERNVIKFNEKKFEQMSWGKIEDIEIEAYKTPSGEDIKIKGNILRNFETRKREPMMNLYKTHMMSKAEYCCVVWSPSHKKDISRIERIQKGYTKRIEGKNYHQRLKCVKLNSMERRRERYM